MSVAKELIDGLAKFADDTKRGDLSGYRITQPQRQSLLTKKEEAMSDYEIEVRAHQWANETWSDDEIMKSACVDGYLTGAREMREACAKIVGERLGDYISAIGLGATNEGIVKAMTADIRGGSPAP